MENKRLHYLLYVSIFYTLLGIIGTYPLVFHLTDYFPENQMSGGFAGCDTLQTYFKLWVFKTNILGGESPIYNDYEFSIDSYRSLVGLQGIPLTPAFLILSLFGDILAYNTLIILSFSLSGLGMYLLVEYLTRNRYSAIISGAFYAMTPFRVGETIVYGHRGGFIALLLPFIVYFYERAFTERDNKSMLWAGLCILMVSFSEWHIMYYILLFTILYVPFKLYQLDKNASIYSKIRKNLGIFIILSLFILLSLGYIMYNKHQKSGMNEFAGWGLDYIEMLSPPLIYFFLKDPMNECYLGIFTLTLMFTLLAYFRRLPKNPVIWFYAIIFIGSILLALGPSFPTQTLSLYGLFYRLMPYFSNFRSPLRVTIMAVFSMAVLLGFAIKKICLFGRKASKRDMLVFMSLLMVFLIVDLSMAPIKLTPSDEDNRAYQTIRDDLEDMMILEVPILNGGFSVGAVYEYYVTVHEKRIINGYTPFPPEEYIQIRRELEGINLGEINSTQYLTLKKLNVGYVVVHEDLFAYLYPNENSTAHINCTTGLLKSDYLDFIEKDGYVWLFYVR